MGRKEQLYRQYNPIKLEKSTPSENDINLYSKIDDILVKEALNTVKFQEKEQSFVSSLLSKFNFFKNK